MSNFDDLVQQGLRARRAAERANQRDEMELGHFGTIFDTTLVRVGADAVRSLVSNKVPSTPVGYIREPTFMGNPKVVRTGECWAFPRGLHLLGDGTWWKGFPQTIPHTAKGIWGPVELLTSEILTISGGGAQGYFITGGGYGDDIRLYFWVVDDTVLVNSGLSMEWAQSFDVWVARHVAELLDQPRRIQR